MGDIWKILIQNGRRFITHSPTISNPKNNQCEINQASQADRQKDPGRNR